MAQVSCRSTIISCGHDDPRLSSSVSNVSSAPHLRHTSYYVVRMPHGSMLCSAALWAVLHRRLRRTLLRAALVP